MDSKQFEALIADAETALKRLRMLYDQWFTGLERFEPQQQREAFERKLKAIQREPTANTAVRFRVQQLQQRFTTYNTYWKRVARQIEEGTYRRDVLRARRNRELRDDEPRAHRDAYELDIDVDIDMDAALGDAMAAVERPAAVEATTAAETAVAQAAAAAEGGLGAPTVSVSPGGPSQPAPRPITPFALPSTPSMAPGSNGAAAGGASRRFPAPPAPAPTVARGVFGASGGVSAPPPRAKSQAPSSPLDGRARPMLSAPPPQAMAPGARASLPAPGPPGAPAVPAVSGPPAGAAGSRAPAPARSMPPAAAPPAARASAPLPPAASNRPASAAGRAGRSQAAVGALGGRSPAGPPTGRPSTGSSVSDQEIRAIYDRYVAARKRNAERTDNVRVETIAKTVRGMMPKLAEKHGGKKIDFEVVVRDGKVALKPVAK